MKKYVFLLGKLVFYFPVSVVYSKFVNPMSYRFFRRAL